MAFPNTPIVDNFNSGAAQNLTARTGWGGTPVSNADTSCFTNATPTGVVMTPGAAFWTNYWNTSFTACEVYMTIATLGTPGSINTFGLYTRLSNVNQVGFFGYTLTLDTIGNILQFYRKDTGGYTTLTTKSLPTTSASGDMIGISSQGKYHYIWHKPVAGSWFSWRTAVDDTYRSGFVGLSMQTGGTGTTSTLDDFGVGAIASTDDARIPRTRGGTIFA